MNCGLDCLGNAFIAIPINSVLLATLCSVHSTLSKWRLHNVANNTELMLFFSKGCKMFVVVVVMLFFFLLSGVVVC